MSEKSDFDGVLEAKKVKEAGKKPHYRRIGRYYKSKKKYWHERRRRKQVFELSSQGLTYLQIAEQLGVSERTVKRDWSKIQPFYDRLASKKWNTLEAKRQKEIEGLLEGKSTGEKLKIIGRLLKEQRWKKRYEHHLRHQIKILIDLDSLKNGLPLPNLTVSPHTPTSSGFPIKIVLKYIKDGKHIPAGTITISNK